MKLYRIKKSKIDNKGRGLYATKNIKAGTKIINYIGKIISNKKVEESEKLKEEAKRQLAEYEKRIGDSKSQVNRMIKEANDQAEKNIIKSNEVFHKLIEIRKKNTEEKIKQLKNQAIKDIKNASVNIAFASIEKLLLNSLDKSKLDKIYIQSIEETKLALQKKSS